LHSKPHSYAQQKFADNYLLNPKVWGCYPNFSPDGKQIISASWDNNLKLWDLAGNCLQTFVGYTAVILNANFSPDGKQIVSASKVWGSYPMRQRQSVCHLGWNLHSISPTQSSWQLQQLWCNDYRLNFTNKVLTTIHATDTAWQLLNFSNGTQTMSIDDYASKN
jgi:WD40 repeat protein